MTLFISPWMDHPWMPSPVSVHHIPSWPGGQFLLHHCLSPVQLLDLLVQSFHRGLKFVHGRPNHHRRTHGGSHGRSNHFSTWQASFCHILWTYKNCLVVSTPLKNISQIGTSSQLLGKIKKQFQTNNQKNIETLKLRLLLSGVLKNPGGWETEPTFCLFLAFIC